MKLLNLLTLFVLLSITLSNATVYFEPTGKTLGTCGNYPDKAGAYIVMKDTINLTQVNFWNSSSLPTIAYIYNAGYTFQYANSSIANGIATFNITLNNSQGYIIVGDNGGSNYNLCQGATSYPILGTVINWGNGYYLGNITTQMYILHSLVFNNGIILNSTGQTPVINYLTIAPSTPHALDVINITFLYNDTGGNSSNIVVGWRVNNTQINVQSFLNVPNNTNMTVNLSSSFALESNVINASVYANDGLNVTNVTSSSVTVVNSFPVISNSSITPVNAYKSTPQLQASVLILHNDSDAVTVNFTWSVNGTNVTSQLVNGFNGTYVTSNLSNAFYFKSDIINVSSQAQDHLNRSNVTYSSNLVIIQNTIPSVSNETIIQNTTFVYVNPMFSDLDLDVMTARAFWYRNNINVFNYSLSGIVNGSHVQINLSNINYTIGDKVYVIVNVSDSYNNSFMISNNYTIVFVPIGNISATNFTVNTPYTIEKFQQGMIDFYTDWGGYILSILCFAFSYAWSAKISQTLIAGGIGMVAIFFMFSNVVFFAGGLLCIVLGYVIKYVAG